MPNCNYAVTCELYGQFSIKASLRVWTLGYCEGDHEKCEGHRLKVAGKVVPPNLLPNGRLFKVGLAPVLDDTLKRH